MYVVTASKDGDSYGRTAIEVVDEAGADKVASDLVRTGYSKVKVWKQVSSFELPVTKNPVKTEV